jgi:hypothetical protein
MYVIPKAICLRTPFKDSLSSSVSKVTRTLRGVKRPEHETDHSSPSSAEIKNAWRYTPLPTSASSRLVAYLSTGTILPLRSG